MIRVVRDMLGATSGLKAAPGTIRGDYSSSRQMNLVHASDGPEAAKREIELYFKPEEIEAARRAMGGEPFTQADLAVADAEGFIRRLRGFGVIQPA